MNAPLISIIVPVYNVEPYLRQCLNSLVNQTLLDIEIICVDDGSTDGSPTILQEYAARDERIRIITQKNVGLSVARNAGMRAARSDYIAFVDSDDYIEPNTYEQALNHMTPDVDYVCFGVQMEGQISEEEIRSYKRYFQHPGKGVINLTDEILLSCDAVAWNKIYRHSIIREHEVSFPEGLKYEDNYFFRAYGAWVRKAFYLPEKYYHYLLREDSIMGKIISGQEGNGRDYIEIAIRLHRYYERQGLLPERDAYLGECFFRLADSAFYREKDMNERRLIMMRLNEFLHVSKPSFMQCEKMAARYERLCNQIKISNVTYRKLFGLIRIKQTAKGRKYYFCGLMIWRVKYQEKLKIHYLLAMLPVYRERQKQV